MGKNTYVVMSAEVIGDDHFGEDCYIGLGAKLRGDYGSIQKGILYPFKRTVYCMLDQKKKLLLEIV
jgi:hypothetical protein